MKKMENQDADGERRDWAWDEIDRDPRLERATREMLVTFFTYAAYVAVIFAAMYSLSAEGAGTASYFLGLPTYLAVVCLIAGGAVAVTSLIAWRLFREDSLEDESKGEGE